MEKTSHLVMFLLLLTAWTVVAGAFIVDDWRQSRRQIATSAWMTTEGTLVAKEITTDAEGAIEVVVEYSYRPSEREFRGKRVAFRALGSEEREAVRGVEPGSPITVHYDPQAPSEAVLVQGLSRDAAATSWLFWGIFTLMTGLGWLAGLGGVVRAAKRRRQTPR